MREILFRGKRADNGEWIKGFYVPSCYIENEKPKTHHYIIPMIFRLFDAKGNEIKALKFEECSYKIKVIPETVGQYTGYEIDDIKVFENDIAKVHLEIPYLPHQDKVIDDIGVVCFDTEDLRYYVISNTGKKYALCYIKEIVENIHDNPELLKGGENG